MPSVRLTISRVSAAPVGQAAGVAAVGPDQGDVPVQVPQPGQQGEGCLAVANVRGGHRDGQDQTGTICDHVALPPVDLLASVVAA